MTDLEALSVQYRDAERRWERAFLRQHSDREGEAAARLHLLRARMKLDEEIEKRLSDEPLAVVDALLERVFRAA